jgi:hypothetical protein
MIWLIWREVDVVVSLAPELARGERASDEQPVWLAGKLVG